MSRIETMNDYHKRIIRMIDYIYDNLDGHLSVGKLAEIACFSEYHWHRIYRGITGETVGQSIRRLRLHKAAQSLIKGKLSIEKIAQNAGYSSIESFTRAFHKTFEMPPASYRKQKTVSLYALNKFKDINMYDVTIKTFDTMKTAGISHQGDYMNIGKAFEKLYAWYYQSGIATEQYPRNFGIYYDDPFNTPEPDLRSFACLKVDDDFKSGNDIELETIQGGRYAVLHFKGPYAELEKPYEWLFGQWLTNSGEEARDAPCFEEYLNDARTVAPNELLTAIHLPLK